LRPYAFVSIALLLAACNSTHNDDTNSNATPTPVPLRSCESRELVLDGVDMVLLANVDGSVDRVTVLSSPNEDASSKALNDERKIFGETRPDTRTQTRPFKQGLVQVVDMCGNPATFNPPSTPTPSPLQK
jgi:hypothetical protein